MPVRGINHVTLAVRDLDCALHFYVDRLGSRLRARWARGAYLEAGTLWLCLELDERASDDPDGHKLEIHVGDLRSRLRACRQRPYHAMELFDFDE